MLRRISAILYKEYLHIVRDKIALLMLIFFPVFVLFLFGFAINLDISHIGLAVYDRDRSESSRRLTDKFIHSGYFDLAYRLHSIGQINPYVDTRKVKVALHIPLDFSKDIYRGRRTPVQLIIDASDNKMTVNLGERLAIPEDAIIDTGKSQIVYVDRGEGFYEPRKVELGIRADGMVEVLKGLKAGEKVASLATFLIDSQSKLRGILPE